MVLPAALADIDAGKKALDIFCRRVMKVPLFRAACSVDAFQVWDGTVTSRTTVWFVRLRRRALLDCSFAHAGSSWKN